ECIEFLKIPCWRAAPTALRDAQIAVTPNQLEFSTGAPRQTNLRVAQLPETHLGAS
ncbi:hypothetical protein A2U01_0084399, partial [Trifolium medium]|nr:hypothetical protein [Trifolium medium]